MEEFEKSLNEKLLKAKKIIKIGEISCGVFGILFFIFLITFSYIKNFLLLFIAILGVMLSFLFVISNKNKCLKSIKKSIFDIILPDIFGEKKAIYVPSGISRSIFNESGLYRNYNNYYTSDGIKNIDEFYFANATAIYKNKNDERKNTAFIGVFGVFKTDEFYKDEIVITPDYENKYISNIIDSKNKLFGENKNVVRLENSEFEKYFEVYSKDQVKAREVVTVEYMEKLVYLRNKLNTLIKVIYLGDKKYVAIWNKRIIDEKDLYKNGIKLDKIIQNIKDIYEVIENT